MRALIRLAEVLEQKLGKEIELQDIGYETVSLMHEEIDTEMVPMSVISKLAEPVICDCANYTDDEGNYYTLISIEIENTSPYEVWLIDDKVVPQFPERNEET